MSTWYESCGSGTVPSMTLNCSPMAPFLVVFSRTPFEFGLAGGLDLTVDLCNYVMDVFYLLPHENRGACR